MLPPQGLSASPSFALPGRGDLIAGRYRIDRKLGHGGMGIVVAAMDEQTGIEVAIKLLRPEEMAPSPAFQKVDESGIAERSSRHQQMSTRLIREASAASRISSEHVARVLDVGRLEGGDPYVVMELLQGVDLGRYMKKRGPLPVPEAVNLVLQACEAIVEAHALGIVHRDLKPANLFLTTRSDGTPWLKVLDFGISKVLGADDNQLTGTTDMLGSPLYMAPEQIRNARDVDGRVDVWSLGTILYRLLAGRAAFEAEGSAATLAAIIGDQPAPLRSLRPDVSSDLEAVVQRCLEKDRSRRIQSVRELAIALQRFASAQSGAAMPVVAFHASSGDPAFQSGPALSPSGEHPALPSVPSFPSVPTFTPSGGNPAMHGVPTFTPSGGNPAMHGVPTFTPSGGSPAMQSVAPNAVTVAGPKSRPFTMIAASGVMLAALAGGALVAWKMFGGAPAAEAGGAPAATVPLGPTASAGAPAASSVDSAPAASATATATASGAAGSAGAATTEAPATTGAPATSASATGGATAGAAGASSSAAASPSVSSSAKQPPRPNRPVPGRPSDDPLGDRL